MPAIAISLEPSPYYPQAFSAHRGASSPQVRAAVLVGDRTNPVSLGARAPLLPVGGVLPGLTMTVPLPARRREGSRSRVRDACSALHASMAGSGRCRPSPARYTPHQRQQGAHDDHRASEMHHCSATHRRVARKASALYIEALFSAYFGVFTLWLSIIATLGSGSRSAERRTSRQILSYATPGVPNLQG